MSDEEKKRRGHVAFPKDVPDRPVLAARGTPGSRVPWVHEEECVGCNLCALVCPVEGCITMVEKRRAPEVVTWNDRIRAGTDLVPGGLEATARARGGDAE
jgi:dihydropyrimidine dehydrogenase (NAD+) subunit PreA